MGDQFLWRFKASGVWDTANNWTDTTASLSPPPSPPGASDSATIDGPADQATYLAIQGPGSADDFSDTGNVGLTGGAFAFGTLTIGASALLDIGAGTSVNASAMPAFTGNVQVTGAGASLTVGGAVTNGGSIIASNGASISLAGLSFMADGFGALYADATSAIEIGPGTGTPPEAGAITVDAGVTIDEPGPVDATFGSRLVDNGTIMVTGTGTIGFPGIDFLGPVSGSGILVATGHSALLFSSTESTNIEFSGSDGLVNFEGGTIGTGTISGFAPGSRLYFDGLAFDSVSYAATGPGLGRVNLTANGASVGAVTLAGTYDAATTFLAMPDVFGDTQVELAFGSAGAGGAGPSAGTGSSDSFAWQPTTGGDWGDAGNWLDNGVAATVAPGSNDLVGIAGSTSQFQVVRGQGNALQLTTTGDIALGGLFATGALNVGNGSITADLALLAGSTVTASGVNIAGGTLSADHATLTVSGGLSDTGSLVLTDHAKVTAASITTPTIYGVLVDASSILDIGGGAGTAGFVTVEDGAVWNGYGRIAAPVIDNGTIAASMTNGEMAIQGAVTGSGTLLIDGVQASITLENGAEASNTIMFAGPTGTLDVAGPLPAAGIGGFAAGDAIVFRTLSFDSVSEQSGGGNTTLTLLRDGSPVGTLDLLGAVPADSSFIVTTAPYLGTGAELQLAAGTLGAGATPPSAGTAGHDTYQWNSSAGGAWGDVANWTDSSAGSTTVAPGTNDTVVIAGASTSLQAISGQGNAASLTLSGELVLGGSFQVGSLDLASFSTVIVAAGATLTASTTSIGVRALDIFGAGAAMSTPGTLQFSSLGTIGVDGGGSLTATGMSTTGETVINVDTASAIEVGAGGGAAIGSMVIDSGATIDGAFLVDAPLIDNGVISTGSLTAQLNGPVSGNGTIVIGNGGGLDVSAPIGAGITIEFAGATGSIELGTRAVGVGSGSTVATTGSIGGSPGLASIAATIIGYGAGDVLTVGGVTVDTADYFATQPGTGELVLGDNGAPVTTLNLAGDYTGASFITAPYYSNTQVLMAAPCFATGTRLLTADGEVAVEQLSVGTRVLALGAGLAPIKWIGFRAVDCRNHPAPQNAWPVRVRAGAFGENVPHRDLLLSPDHAVFVDGVLIPVRYLVNDVTVVQQPVASVTYWHVELDRHDVVLAEGLRCESYLDTGNRGGLANRVAPWNQARGPAVVTHVAAEKGFLPCVPVGHPPLYSSPRSRSPLAVSRKAAAR